MARTYWYGYDRSGEPTGPFYETRGEAADAIGDDELLRPIDGSVLPSDAEVVGESTDAEYRAVTDSGDGDADDADDGPQKNQDHETTAEILDAGECPWCDEYEGDSPGRHASAAHSDAWEQFKNSDAA